MQDKKKIVIGTLCALIMIMAVGYALLSQQLSINGSASITSNWQVEITNITEKEKSTGATTNNTNYTATTASFNTSLTSPGDYALYEVTVTNKGTLDAVLSAEPTITTGNNTAIQYELVGIKKGDKILKNNQTDTFTIKVQYNPSVTSQPSTLTSNIEVTLNYEQDLGQIVSYDAYSIGDKITFAGSNWYVIKNSTSEEDYVTLMKEMVLSNSELGSYAYNSTSNAIAYYFDPAGCYYDATMSPEGSITNGCQNMYNRSQVKDFLEGTYINVLDATKLKEVDGYKIRLITLNELITNLGYTKRVGTNFYDYSSTNTPTWVYQNYGEGSINISGYWTMTPVENNNFKVWVSHNDIIWDEHVYGGINGIRPVINLLKSAIE